MPKFWLAEGEGFEPSVRLLERVTQWRIRTSKKPLFEPRCGPTLPITLSGADGPPAAKNTV
jgi:hypothetical protein